MPLNVHELLELTAFEALKRIRTAMPAEKPEERTVLTVLIKRFVNQPLSFRRLLDMDEEQLLVFKGVNVNRARIWRTLCRRFGLPARILAETEVGGEPAHG